MEVSPDEGSISERQLLVTPLTLPDIRDRIMVKLVGIDGVGAAPDDDTDPLDVGKAAGVADSALMLAADELVHLVGGVDPAGL